MKNPRRKRPIVGKYGIQSTNEMAFKRTVTLRASFRFPAIRFDAPTLLSFSGCTHAHAKCPPVQTAMETRGFCQSRNFFSKVIRKIRRFHSAKNNLGVSCTLRVTHDTQVKNAAKYKKHIDGKESMG